VVVASVRLVLASVRLVVASLRLVVWGRYSVSVQNRGGPKVGGGGGVVNIYKREMRVVN